MHYLLSFSDASETLATFLAAALGGGLPPEKMLYTRKIANAALNAENPYPADCATLDTAFDKDLATTTASVAAVPAVTK